MIVYNDDDDLSLLNNIIELMETLNRIEWPNNFLVNMIIQLR